MSWLKLKEKIKKCDDIKALAKIAREHLKHRQQNIYWYEQECKKTQELETKVRQLIDERDHWKSRVDIVANQALESGDSIMRSVRKDTIEDAAHIAETFFNDDVVEGFQIAQAIRELDVPEERKAHEPFTILPLEKLYRRK